MPIENSVCRKDPQCPLPRIVYHGECLQCIFNEREELRRRVDIAIKEMSGIQERDYQDTGGDPGQMSSLAWYAGAWENILKDGRP